MDASRTTPLPRPDRFERRRAQTRQALIGAARWILAERGSDTASIQQIADRADVGFGAFYNHFESKDALFDAAALTPNPGHGLCGWYQRSWCGVEGVLEGDR